ncbi:tetratricopeptide-like helical domain-containing protein [Tanacetum coccineum]|uniref:Tetratricopeptide-like helical domain-containing protein n=1 Tax=Tanacetum coccineum TaxID=301880 RepID=A0ABQ5C0S9_9ASTR
MAGWSGVDNRRSKPHYLSNGPLTSPYPYHGVFGGNEVMPHVSLPKGCILMEGGLCEKVIVVITAEWGGGGGSGVSLGLLMHSVELSRVSRGRGSGEFFNRKRLFFYLSGGDGSLWVLVGTCGVVLDSEDFGPGDSSVRYQRLFPLLRLCKIGNNVIAIQLLRLMDEKACKPNVVTYSNIIDSLCKDKMVDDAFKLLKEMVFQQGISPDVIT